MVDIGAGAAGVWAAEWEQRCAAAEARLAALEADAEELAARTAAEAVARAEAARASDCDCISR
jgi:hypothetical protein